MTLEEKVSRGIGWSLLENVVIQLIGLATFSILTRTIPPSDFGIVAYATVYIEFCHCMLARGIPDALIQRKEISRIHLNTTFWASVLVGFFLSIITYSYGFIAAEFFSNLI